MNPITAYISAIKQPFNYSGTASRLEYWMCFVGFLILSIIIWLVCSLLGLDFMSGTGSVISFILGLFLITLPGLALGARRLNDIGWPVWLIVLGIFGPIVWIIFGIVPGKK
ncbi:MAG: DUF805 domain-containing protein [Verrucomicrobia bacterium]|nr:DUF805 domain-containing protein [Verrucomicrobiota bacterium]